tara:strand:- start:373 stop:564 length:192 start_codon:yes stop_codon:yes gene_type:complete
MYIFYYDLDTDLGFVCLTIEFDVDEGCIEILSIVDSRNNKLTNVFDDDSVARLAFEWLSENGE